MSCSTTTLSRWLLALASTATVVLTSCATRDTTIPVTPIDPSPGFDVPVPEVFLLRNSLPVRFVKTDHVPLVTIALIIPCGSASDPDGKEGLASLTASMLDEGAGPRVALDLAEEFEFLGASLSIDTERDYATISMQVLERNLSAAFDLFADVVIRPRFDDKEWARVKRLRLNSLHQRRENATSVARLVGNRLFYGAKHPYSHPSAGFVDSVEKIELDDVRAFWKSVAHPFWSTLLVTGDFETEKLKSLLDDTLGGWKSDGEFVGSPLMVGHATTAQARSKARLIVVDKPDAPQTVIRVYQVAPPFGVSEVAPLVLANTIVGGTFTSRLNSNLREDKKITYGARSFLHTPLFDLGHIVASTSVETDATAMGLAELHRELQAISTGELREGELGKARSSRWSRLVESMERQTSLLAIYETSVAARKPPEERRDFYGRLLRVTEKEVASACRKTYDWDRVLIVLVGDREKIVSALETLRDAEGAKKLDLAPGFRLPEPQFKDHEGR
jgi:predicted Zn-dependent peptidase